MDLTKSPTDLIIVQPKGGVYPLGGRVILPYSNSARKERPVEIRIYRKANGRRDLLVKRQALGRQKAHLISDVAKQDVKQAVRDMIAELGQETVEAQANLLD